MKQPTDSLPKRRFERVVCLVDVKVLIEQEDRRNCAAHIFNSVVTVLEKCKEHSRFSVLWGYVFFDSSRSPVASSTTIGKLLAGLSTRERFDGITQNLEKFGKVLDAVVASGDGYTSAGESKADCLVRSVAAVASDFPWDPLFVSDSSSSDEEMRRSLQNHKSHPGDQQVSKLNPNLVIVFSCLPTCSSQVARFLDFQPTRVDSDRDNKLPHEFCFRFRSVKSVLDSKNIQCCWIDVPSGESSSQFGHSEDYVKLQAEPSVSRRCLMEFAWSFVPLSLVANIRKHVPLRLIWNIIAYLRPNFIDCRAVASRDAKVRNSRSPSIFFSVGVQPWTSTVSTSSHVGHVSRVSGLFPAKKSLEKSKRSSASKEVEIVILSKISRRNHLNLSSERYLVLQKPSEAVISPTGIEKVGEPRAGDLKAEDPSWPGLLISLESEESAVVVSVDPGGCSCQAILEPLTLNSALLTVVDTTSSHPGRKLLPTRLSCHLSRISNNCMKEKLQEFAKERGILSRTGNKEEVTKAGVKAGGSGDFEKSFEGTLLKVVKDKRRGCVLFKSVKKQRVESGKTLDSTHDCFQGNTSEPERVSWLEYWQRVVNRAQKEHMPLDRGCSTSGFFVDIKSSSVEEYLQDTDNHSQVAGTSTGCSQTQFDPASFQQGRECTSQSALRHASTNSCISVPSSPPQVVGNFQLSPAISPDYRRASSSATAHTIQSRSPCSGDDGQSKSEMYPSPTLELPLFGTPILEQTVHPAPNSFGTHCEAAMNENVNFGKSNGQPCLEQLVQNVYSSESVDLHQFAKSVVSEARRELQNLHACIVVSVGTAAREGESSQISDALVAVRLRKLLFKKPRQLMSKYKELLASTATTTRSKDSILEEKLREHELQIIFRLEVLALVGEFYDKKKQECCIKDICQLLDNIQFHLYAGNGSEDGLQQYCERVIVLRYKGLLPSTVSKILSAMELNGYCDPSQSTSVFLESLQTSEMQPSSEDVAAPQSGHEATGLSSDAPCNSSGQPKGLLADGRRLSSEADCKPRLNSEGNASNSTNSAGKENLAILNYTTQDVPHKQEQRQRKTYHFSSGANNLLRVKAVKPREHLAIKRRKTTKVSRNLATRISDYNTKVKVDSKPPVPRKDARMLQNGRKDISVVCQTPTPPTRAFVLGQGRHADVQGVYHADLPSAITRVLGSPDGQVGGHSPMLPGKVNALPV